MQTTVWLARVIGDAHLLFNNKYPKELFHRKSNGNKITCKVAQQGGNYPEHHLRSCTSGMYLCFELYVWNYGISVAR